MKPPPPKGGDFNSGTGLVAAQQIFQRLLRLIRYGFVQLALGCILDAFALLLFDAQLILQLFLGLRPQFGRLGFSLLFQLGALFLQPGLTHRIYSCRPEMARFAPVGSGWVKR